MADKKISQLTAATTPLAGTETLPIVQSGNTVKATVQDVANLAGAPYKVYTALLTQSGGDDPQGINGDEAVPLTIGVTYEIVDNTGLDVTNVGSPNNNIGTKFVATGTTPNSWGNIDGWAILGYNTGAPVVTVLENTIGNIWWTYDGVGVYGANTDGLFTDLQTFVLNGPLNNANTNGFQVLFEANYPNMLAINLYDTSFSNTNGIGDNLAIEIRVYN